MHVRTKKRAAQPKPKRNTVPLGYARQKNPEDDQAETKPNVMRWPIRTTNKNGWAVVEYVSLPRVRCLDGR